MKERPILFSAPMVRAILDGRKTQTRRVVKPQPANGCIYQMNGARDKAVHWDGKGCFVPPTPKSENHLLPCPYGQHGDKLWVRETWQGFCRTSYEYDEWESMQSPKDRYEGNYTPVYRADGKNFPEKWFPAIHMPRKYCRIELVIKSVRVERLNSISDADALAEGVDQTNTSLKGYATERFKRFWESINNPGSWAQNPWVWVIEFERVKP